jgi:hypothetical protein
MYASRVTNLKQCARKRSWPILGLHSTIPARTEDHHCDPEADLSKSRPRSERNSPQYNLEVLLCKSSFSVAMSHQLLLRRLWPMFKRCASYPFQNLCTCSSCSRRDAIPSSCAQMYPPAQAFTLELNNILYPLFVSNLLFPFIHCSFLHYFLLFAFLLFY